jgi:predicted DNA binding CopG/RHH family protein
MATKRKKPDGALALAWDDAGMDRAEPDHRAVEAMRARPALRSITLRLGVEQIAEARRTAALTGVPYQVVLRRWIALGAASAQNARRRAPRARRRRH